MKKETKGNLQAESCPASKVELKEFHRAINMVVGKWKMDILWVLSRGPMRFGELRRALPGITQHMLTAQLRALEVDGLVNRTAYAEIPPRVEYALTDGAMKLGPIFLSLVEWARNLRGKVS